MKNRIIILTKYFLKNSFQEMLGKSKKKSVFLLLLLFFSLCALSAPFALLISVGYEEMKSLGNEKIFIDTILAAGSSISCFLGIYSVMNIFYFSDDVEEILPLPFKGNDIVFAKFITVLLNMYFYTAITIPPLIMYGIYSNSGLVYYVYMILIIILQPIVPMILSSLICIILMRFTNLSKHKDIFRMFTGCLSMVFVIAFNLFNSNTNTSGTETLLEGISNNPGVLNALGNIFINDKFSSKALINSSNLEGLKFMLLTIAVCIVLFAVYYILTGNLYLKGIIGSSETTGKRKDILKESNGEKFIRKNSILKSLIYKDIKLVFRTPQFFVNNIAMIFYTPAIISISFFRGEGLEWIKSIVSNSEQYGSQVIAAAFVLGCLCVMTGGASSTALSREGKDISVCMYLPIDHNTILKSKILSSLIINGISILLSIGIFIFIKTPLIMIIFTTIASACAVLIISMIGLYIDFKSPKVDWDNEKDMFKKNYSILLIMLAAFLLGAVVFIISNFIYNYVVMTLICVVISLIISYLLKLEINSLSIKFWKSKMIG